MSDINLKELQKQVEGELKALKKDVTGAFSSFLRMLSDKTEQYVQAQEECDCNCEAMLSLKKRVNRLEAKFDLFVAYIDAHDQECCKENENISRPTQGDSECCRKA